ncbi:hypothetical protein BST27_26685 [Mycobacterium intermedium]|uniref:Uncharacterized protein n=1 Tax=Mycobacterium intermedium TaxID=28445 RepID=A0A1T3W1M0_MYCIE|nr:hypothetical protein BV508_18810 [Mycobacterium intermedium]ORA95671.1 hypothetical protein BST27_26685 [Mycobacterium intermedium]
MRRSLARNIGVNAEISARAAEILGCAGYGIDPAHARCPWKTTVKPIPELETCLALRIGRQTAEVFDSCLF